MLVTGGAASSEWEPPSRQADQEEEEERPRVGVGRLLNDWRFRAGVLTGLALGPLVDAVAAVRRSWRRILANIVRIVSQGERRLAPGDAARQYRPALL